MFQASLGAGIGHVGRALREPEEFALRWHRGEVRYGLFVWASLAATAVLGTLTYGMTLGIQGGPAAIAGSALKLTLAAGLAWAIPFPGLYILNSLSGSRLPAGTTLLAAAVTTSWGGLALIASIPVNWFFTVAVPEPWVTRLVNLLVFAGVGLSMADTFARVMERLEPARGRGPAWFLVLVGAIGAELSYALGLLDFPAQP